MMFRHFPCVRFYDSDPAGGEIEHTVGFFRLGGDLFVQPSFDETWDTIDNGSERSIRRITRGRAPSVLVGLPHFLARHVEVLATTRPRRLMKVSFALVCVVEERGKWVTHRKSFRTSGTGWLKRYVVLPKTWAQDGYCMSAGLATSRGPTALAVRLTTHE